MSLSRNGYQAVLFDLDGTIRHMSESPIELFFRSCREMGLNFDDDARLRLARWQHGYWADNEQIRADRERGESEFWVQVSRKQLRFLGVDGDVDWYARQLDGRFREVLGDGTGIVEPDVAPTLRTLRERGYTVGLVSNRTQPLAEPVAELGLEGLFHFTLSAGEANSWKPDAGIFQLAMEMSVSAAESTVYVGDNYYADVVGARAAGLVPLLLDPHDVFPDADCDRIRSIGEVLPWLAAVNA